MELIITIPGRRSDKSGVLDTLQRVMDAIEAADTITTVRMPIDYGYGSFGYWQAVRPINQCVQITYKLSDQVDYAVITGNLPGTDALYCVGRHFGMNLYADQFEGHPSFDPESPIAVRYCDPTPEHEEIAAAIGCDLTATTKES